VFGPDPTQPVKSEERVSRPSSGREGFMTLSETT
jgi:hypothetical protein